MFIEGLEPQSAQSLFAGVIEIHELVRQHAGKRDKATILEVIPYAAGHGYLFGCVRANKVVAMSIAGPTDRPGSLFNFRPDGKILYGHYGLVHPGWRHCKGRPLVASLWATMLEAFPECEMITYVRHGKDFKPWPRAAWEKRLCLPSSAAAKETSGTHANGRWASSRSPTKDPSEDCSSPPSSTSSYNPTNFGTPLLGGR